MPVARAGPYGRRPRAAPRLRPAAPVPARPGTGRTGRRRVRRLPPLLLLRHPLPDLHLDRRCARRQDDPLRAAEPGWGTGAPGLRIRRPPPESRPARPGPALVPGGRPRARTEPGAHQRPGAPGRHRERQAVLDGVLVYAPHAEHLPVPRTPSTCRCPARCSARCAPPPPGRGVISPYGPARRRPGRGHWPRCAVPPRRRARGSRAARLPQLARAQAYRCSGRPVSPYLRVSRIRPVRSRCLR